MKFIQTISFTSSKMDEMRKVMDDYSSSGADAPGFIRSTVLKNRDRPNAYLVIAEFESYEQAMENSARPETDAMAKKMGELVDGEVTYGNYDVIAEEGS
jgi:quinol monooxygenase YgiN